MSIKVEKSTFFPDQSTLQYRNSDFKRFNRMNFSTLCTILVAFGPENPEFMLLTMTPFATIWQKSAYHAKYLRMSWTYIALFYRFGRCISADDYPNIRLAVAQGTLLWQLVKFGTCSQTSSGTTFILCFNVRNVLADRKSAFKRFSGNNQATSYPNLVLSLIHISEPTRPY